MQKDGILKRLMSNIGMFENIFGKYADKILYNKQKEKIKRILTEIYGKTDVHTLFPEEVDKIEYNRTLKTLFTYYEADDLNTKK